MSNTIVDLFAGEMIWGDTLSVWKDEDWVYVQIGNTTQCFTILEFLDLSSLLSMLSLKLSKPDDKVTDDNMKKFMACRNQMLEEIRSEDEESCDCPECEKKIKPVLN